MVPESSAALLGLAAAILVIATAAILHRRRCAPPPEHAATVAPSAAGDAPPEVVAAFPSAAAGAAGRAMLEARAELHRLTFPGAEIECPASGLHAEVIRLVDAALEGAVLQREYFPRRPLLIPELLAAVNDPRSSQARWAEIVLRDPVLAADVLRIANSAWFRTSPEPIETMPKAIRLLGADGLRSVIATSVLQPVFRCPVGSFGNFPEVTWDQALNSGLAAQYLAGRTGDADAAVAHLLGLVAALGRIVVFRLTLDTYRSQQTVAPRAEVLVQLLDAHADRAAQLVTSSWGLPEEFARAIAEQDTAAHALPRSGLGRLLAFGRLAGTLATLVHHGRQTEQGAKSILREAGLGPEAVEGLWARFTTAAASTDRSRARAW